MLPRAATVIACPSTCSRDTSSVPPRSVAAAVTWAAGPSSPGNGAAAPVMATTPSAASVGTPPGTVAVRSNAAWPAIDGAPSAASGARSGRSRCAFPVFSPDVRASPVSDSSLWVRANVTGRPGSSSRASARSVTGVAANRSAAGPGIRTPSAVASTATLPRSPLSLADRVCSEAPAAVRASIVAEPCARGAAHGPCTCASTCTDCHARSGRGAIAGACALTSRSTVWPGASTRPSALAVSAPAVSARCATRADHGPSAEACSDSAPNSGRLASAPTKPCVGSSASSAAATEVSVMRPCSR